MKTQSTKARVTETAENNLSVQYNTSQITPTDPKRVVYQQEGSVQDNLQPRKSLQELQPKKLMQARDVLVSTKKQRLSSAIPTRTKFNFKQSAHTGNPVSTSSNQQEPSRNSSNYDKIKLYSVGRKGLRPAMSTKLNTEQNKTEITSSAQPETTNFQTNSTTTHTSLLAKQRRLAPLEKRTEKSPQPETISSQKKTDVDQVEKESQEQKNIKKKLKKSFKKLWRKNSNTDLFNKNNDQALEKFYSRLRNDEQSKQNESQKHSKFPHAVLKRERENLKFNEKLKQQLVEWDQEADIQAQGEESQEKMPNFTDEIKKPQIYKERQDDYCIIASQIQVMNMATERRHENKKNINMCSSIDHIRIKIRIIPQDSKTVPLGKNADYYFIQAAKKSVRGDLTVAIDLLKRGLMITPDHYKCRFNLGVLMFKFGLMVEAYQDFKACKDLQPQQPWPYFNLAVCLIQFGLPFQKKFERANSEDSKCHRNTNADSELRKTSANQRYQEAIDLCTEAISLKGSDTLLEIDAYYLQAICHYRLQKPLESVQCLITAKRKERLMKMEAKRIKSNVQEPVQQYAELFLGELVVNLSLQEKTNFLHRTNSLPNLEKRTISPAPKVTIETTDKNQKTITQQSVQPPKQASSILSLVKTPASSKSPKKDSQSQTKDKGSSKPISSLFQNLNQNAGDFFRKMIKKKFEKFVKIDNAQRQSGESYKEIKLTQKYYNEFVEQQERAINVDEDGAPSLTRVKQIYINQHDIEGGVFEDCNQEEVKLLKHRHDLEQWWSDDFSFMEMIQNLIQSIKNDAQNSDFWLQRIMKCCDLKSENVPGSADFESIDKILQDQNLVEKIMEDFKLLQIRSANEVDQSQSALEQEIHSLKLTRQDLNNLRLKPKMENLEDYIMNNKDSLNQFLIESRDNASMTIDDVTNMLRYDLDEKRKQRQQNLLKLNQNYRRFNNKHMLIIKLEFLKSPEDRSYQVIDDLCQELRFFKRYSPSTRKIIFENSTFLTFEANQVVYNQGDPGDFMFIILKGKVRLEKSHQLYKEVPTNLNSYTDGDFFGGPSQEDETQPGEGSLFTKVQTIWKKIKRPSKVTCLEETVVFMLENEYYLRIIEPDKFTFKPILESQQEQENVQTAPTPSLYDAHLVSKVEQNQNIIVNHKIKFLQKFDFFNLCPNKVLLPIASNMQQVNFAYGDFLIKEGEIPRGLFLIKSGICNANKSRICSRPHFATQVPGAKKMILDPNPIFNKYDPDNTILNGVHRSDKAFQNSRIYFDELGNQLSDQIQFQDLQLISKIMPRGHFGGRVLPPFELYLNYRRSQYGSEYVDRPKDSKKIMGETEEQYQLKSFLNVIANSRLVETYLITKVEMQHFHDQDLKLIYERLILNKDADRPYPEAKMEEIFKNYEMWQKKKFRDVEEVRYQNTIAKRGVLGADPKEAI